MTRFLRLCLATTALLTGLGFAQVVVPEFGTRGEVEPEVLQAVMTQLRLEIARQTGLNVNEGDLVTPGIAASLDADYAYMIAQLGGGRYALSGELRRVEAGGLQAPYALSILIADDEAERASDILSEAFNADNLSEAVTRLASEVTRFVQPVGMLETGPAQLFISSTPGGAKVLINGFEVGETAQLDVLMLKPGSYEIELRKEGFLPATRTVSLSAERPELMNVVLTQLVGGSIQVSSTPRADVYVDGEFIGDSPLTVQVRPGTRTVSLQRAGFELLSLEVPVQNYRVNQISQTLTPIFDNMLFWDVSRVGLLSIDGVLRTGGFVADLSPGMHLFEARVGGERHAFTVQTPASGVFEIDMLNEILIPMSRP